MAENKKSASSGAAIALTGLVVVVLVVIVGLLGGFALLLQALGLGSQTALNLERAPDEEFAEFHVSLPRTDGEIDLVFAPVEGIETVIGADAVNERLGHYQVTACNSGCQIRIRVGPPYTTGTVTIDYLAGDSEYVDDIEIAGGTQRQRPDSSTP